MNPIRNKPTKSRTLGVLLTSVLMLGLLAPTAQAERHVERVRLLPSANRGVVTLPSEGDPDQRLRRLELERGKSVVLRAEYRVKRVSVGDPNIADVVVLNANEIHLVAKKIGDTNVIVWSSDGTLQGAIDLHVGRPHSQIENELRRVLSNDTIQADGAGESVVLKGTVSSPAEMERALKVANAFFPQMDDTKAGKDADRVINLLDVGGNQQVMLEVVIAEMSRSVRRNLGTNFAGVTTDGSTDLQVFSFLQNLATLDEATDIIQLSSQVNLVSRIAHGSDQLDIFMEAIEENGLAKVLAEPTLVARSGEDAHFLVGGEVPIPVPQSGAIGVITIKFKEFGVGLTFTPTVLGPDRIHMKMTAEVSEPDLTLGAQLQGFVVPAFTTRKAATSIELGDGQSFAVAGLLSDTVRELSHQFPFLGDIPIVGALFRSTRFVKDETELVMMVTPRLVKPLPPGEPVLPTDVFVEPNAFELFFLGELEGDVFGRHAESETLDRALRAKVKEPIGAMELLSSPDSGANSKIAARGEVGAFGGLVGESGHRVDVRLAKEKE